MNAAPKPRISWKRTPGSICIPGVPFPEAFRQGGKLISRNRRSPEVAHARAWVGVLAQLIGVFAATAVAAASFKNVLRLLGGMGSLDKIQNSVYGHVLESTCKQTIVRKLADLRRKNNRNFIFRAAWQPGKEKR